MGWVWAWMAWSEGGWGEERNRSPALDGGIYLTPQHTGNIRKVTRQTINDNIWYYLMMYPFWTIWAKNFHFSARTYRLLVRLGG